MKNNPMKGATNLQIRVYYEDTDAGGVVYHSNYLNFMERARTEWLRHIGFEQGSMIKQNEILFVVHKINIDYRKPAFLNELLNVKTNIIEQRKVSLIFKQIISNQSEKIICEAEAKITCVDCKTMRPTPIPETIISELN